MVNDPIFRKSMIVAALLATFSLSATADGVNQETSWQELPESIEIGDLDLTFTGERVTEDRRINLTLGSDAKIDDLRTGSMFNLRDLQIDEGARLTLSLKNEGDDYDVPGRGYWCGASFVPSAEREGSLGLDVEVGAGTIFLVGSNTAPGGLGRLSQIAADVILDEKFHNDEGKLPSVMIFQETLKLYKEDCFAIGSTLEAAKRKDTNLLVGQYGVLMIDQENLHLSNALIETEEGAKIEFERGSAIVVARPFNEDNETAELQNADLATSHLNFFSPGANVVGWRNVHYVNHITGMEGRIEKNEEGDFIVVEKPWMTEGVMAAPANALYQAFLSNSASEAVNRFFNSISSSNNVGIALLRNTLLAKSLGTTSAMSDAAAGGTRFAQQAFLRNPNAVPVNVEILGGRSEGRSDDAEKLMSTWERETEGLALSVRGAKDDWLWGMRILYEDANVDIESRYINRVAVDAESTLLAGSLYIGKQVENTTIVADLTVTGAEDRVDFFQTGDVKIGSDDIARRSVSLGVTGLYQPTADFAGWRPTLRAGLQLTDYFKTDYDIELDGENLWEVEEQNRLVATADFGLDIERSWHRYTRVETDDQWRTRDDWLTLGLSGGVRARAGDIETSQTVTAAGASATIETDDLGQWEAYAELGIDASWKDALFGISAEGVWGPDDREACRMRVKVVWEY